MILKLKQEDIDTLLDLLQDAVTRGRNRGEYTAHFSQLQGIITGQQEQHYNCIVDQITTKAMMGETIKVADVHAAYRVTYKVAAKLIQRAKERAFSHEA